MARTRRAAMSVDGPVRSADAERADKDRVLLGAMEIQRAQVR